MNEEENNIPIEEVNEPKKSMGERLSSAYNNYQTYQNMKQNYQEGGLGGVAKGLARDAISNKANQYKDKAKEKFNDKKEQLKDKAKNKIDSKLPDSVKQKRDSTKAKYNQTKDKIKNSKLGKAAEIAKNPRAKINEKIFRKTVKTAVDTVAPGTGAIAEKMLDTSKGESALQAAREQGVKEGVKELTKIVVFDSAKKQLLAILLPSLVTIFIVVIVMIGVISKFNDSQTFAKGGLDSVGVGGVEEVDKKYQAFYENVDKHGGSNRAMIIAVLTAYKDNDDYTNTEDYESSEQICTTEEIENGDCIVEIENGITKYSKSKMKKYIKKVAKAINSSGGNVEEGDYKDPENTGSEFFKWLYKEFVDDYYEEYLDKNAKNYIDKKEEIVHFIYLYYEDIKDNIPASSSFVSTSCPNGITIVGDKTYELDEYVAGVVEAENNWYEGDNISAMKAQAIAARTYVLKYTNNCEKSIPNNQSAQTYKTPSVKSLQAATETSGEVLTYDGEIFKSEYDGFYGTCSGDICTATYEKIPGGETHTIKVPIRFVPGYARNYYGHGRGMSQYGSRWLQSEKGMDYIEILKYFYSDGVEVSTMSATVVGDLYAIGGTNGIMSESLFPINKEDISKIYKSAGWYYSSGKYHGAVDFASLEGGLASHSIGIYAAYDGVVTDYFNQNCNGYSQKAANKTGLPYKSGCRGKQIRVEVQDGPYAGYSFAYVHLSSFVEGIQKGAQIKAGQLIGYMGNTGNSSGPHLHFNLRDKNGNDININPIVDQFLANYK